MDFYGIDFPPEAPIPDFGGSTQKEHVFGLKDERTFRPELEYWQAIWRDNEDAYRMHVLSPVDAVHAAHGPGQETLRQAGRRLRYLDLERSGSSLSSTFVTLHERGGSDGGFAVRSINRFTVPDKAGADAVALRIESDWGTYLIFNDFAVPVTIDSVRFQGTVGIFKTYHDGSYEKLVCGEKHWSGEIKSMKDSSFETDTRRPAGWPRIVPDVKVWVRLGDGKQFTGYPVTKTGHYHAAVERFLLQPAATFHLPSVVYAKYV